MEYKRLTDKDITKVCFDTWELCGLDNVCKRDCREPEPCKIPQIIHRLAELEDKIENGTLVECLVKSETLFTKFSKTTNRRLFSRQRLRKS